MQLLLKLPLLLLESLHLFSRKRRVERDAAGAGVEEGDHAETDTSDHQCDCARVQRVQEIRSLRSFSFAVLFMSVCCIRHRSHVVRINVSTYRAISHNWQYFYGFWYSVLEVLFVCFTEI